MTYAKSFRHLSLLKFKNSHLKHSIEQKSFDPLMTFIGLKAQNQLFYVFSHGSNHSP